MKGQPFWSPFVVTTSDQSLGWISRFVAVHSSHKIKRAGFMFVVLVPLDNHGLKFMSVHALWSRRTWSGRRPWRKLSLCKTRSPQGNHSANYQLGLKLVANSFYGFFGTAASALPSLAIARSITAYGRQMIAQTKEKIETHFTMANGYSHDAQVIYGVSFVVYSTHRDLSPSRRRGLSVRTISSS